MTAASGAAMTGPMPVPSQGPVPVSRFLFHSQPEAVRRAIGGVMGGLGHLPLDGDARDTLQIVLAEVLNNIVEHACRDRPDKVIEVTVAAAGNTIRCVVEDDGLPMPDEVLPAGLPPDPADLPEGGFGWFLIRHLTSELQYHRDGDRNRTSFAVPIQGT